MRNRFSAQLSISDDGRPLARDVAPDKLRAVVVNTPLAVREFKVEATRDAICRGLKTIADNGNWSRDNIISEIRSLILDAEWYRVYDAAEAVGDELRRRGFEEEFADYQNEINRTLGECFIGWRMVDGRFEIRGEESTQAIHDQALEHIAASGLGVAASEMREAVKDLSRRPEPDLSGAVHHALGCLEAIARHSTGDPNSTLGEVLKKYPNLLREPIKSAADKLWGYASEQARHVREGRTLDFAEVELVVGAAVVLSNFLVGQLSEGA